MTKVELYTYKCLDCKKTFRTDNPDEKVCPSCKKYRKPHNSVCHHTKHIPTFAEILHIADVYNKIHNKYIHYGDVVNLINSNPKRCICCGAGVYKDKHICSECERRWNK